MTDYDHLADAEDNTELALQEVEAADDDTMATTLAIVCLTLAKLLIRAASEGDSEKA